MEFDFAEPLDKYIFFGVLADGMPERHPRCGNGLYILEVVEHILNKGTIDKQRATRALHHTLEIPIETCKAAEQTTSDVVYMFVRSTS